MPHRFTWFLAAFLIAFTGADRAIAQPSPLLIASPRATPPEDPEDEAQRPERQPPPDPLLPGAGNVALTLGGGIPFGVIGEVAVGLSDRAALGVVVGASSTFTESAIGGRLRVGLWSYESVDVMLALPVLYYPPSDFRRGSSWVLTNPSLLVRGRLGERVGLYGGVGGLLAACTDTLAQTFGDHHHAPHDHGRPMVNGAWNTFHLGTSVHVAGGFSAHLDTMMMAEGVLPAVSYRRKIGPPYMALAAASYVF